MDTADSIRCAFCKGSGIDTFGLLSAESMCPVCGGRGKNVVREPRVPCAFCRHTGVQATSRMTCTGCCGKGAHTVAKPQVKCPVCAGVGKAPGSLDLPCPKCDGAGLIHSSITKAAS